MNYHRGEFYVLIIFATSGMMLMAGALNLITVFLGIELMSVPLYVLAGFMRKKERANEAALKVKGVQFVNSGVSALREIKTLVTSEGTNTTQTFIRVSPTFSATAVQAGDFQTYEEELAPRGEGWDYVVSSNMPCNAERWARWREEACRSVEQEAGMSSGQTTAPFTSPSATNELDRPGEEANYLKHEFVAPPRRFGS
jgi:hypothetical protein